MAEYGTMLETTAAPAVARSGRGGPFRAALDCLAEADVRFCLLRDRLEDLENLRDLDLLVHPGDRRIAFAALGRAGFVVRHDRRLRSKWVFLRWEAGRFFVIDLHVAFVQRGLVYMGARRALARLDRAGPVPRLGREDEFLHLVMHNLLGKGALQEKHRARLFQHRDAGLDPGRLAEQARACGLQAVVRRIVADLDRLASDPAAWAALRRRARAHLLLHPANVLGAWRYTHGGRLGLGRRPVVLALLGPDGAGKTTFADALEAVLRDSPLRAGRVYMGSWGHDLLPMRSARRLVPPQASATRVLLRACGLPVSLGPQDVERLAARPSLRQLAWAAVRFGIKNAAFHAALSIEMLYRYARHIAFSNRPIVITDRYVYDLEFRQGKVPFVHGARTRRLWYRLFPAPDGVLYLTTPYDVVARRKPQLDRTTYETMDAVFRRVLAPYAPLEITTDDAPPALVRAFLTQHLEHLVERCNRRA